MKNIAVEFPQTGAPIEVVLHTAKEASPFEKSRPCFRSTTFPESTSPLECVLLLVLVLGIQFMVPRQGYSAGVTVITHGFYSDVDSWVTGMADQVPLHPAFLGTNFTTYKLSVTHANNQYYVTTTRVDGSHPSASVAGEIMVKLDWSELAGDLLGAWYSTYDVAWPVAWALLQTNLIAELGGHALAELPLHLIGHSRGGSLMCEVSRLLGTNGVWVDHLTTLDPHPLNNDGNFDPLMATDASASNTFANVLFRDNYWQDVPGGIGDVNGEPADGAYNRHLDALSGGYESLLAANNHSDVHLWYHGTIALDTPTRDSDTGAWITIAERQNWWSPYENEGKRAGFYYSLIGRGDRLSYDQPLGPGFDAVRDGYNQKWNLGAGTSDNRAALPSNRGTWPNPIKFNRVDTKAVVQGQSISVELYCQWAQPTNSFGTVSFYLDDDLNPWNANDRLLREMTMVGSGGASVMGFGRANLSLNTTNAPTGYHALYVRVSGGGRSRYLYVPELVKVVPPPALDISLASAGQFQVGVNGEPGQTIVLYGSPDLVTWQPLVTNTLTTARWFYLDDHGAKSRYYQASLQ